MWSSIDTIVEEQKQKERRCPVCGKVFRPAPEHVWKIGKDRENNYVCTYTCMRRVERGEVRVKNEN